MIVEQQAIVNYLNVMDKAVGFPVDLDDIMKWLVDAYGADDVQDSLIDVVENKDA